MSTTPPRSSTSSLIRSRDLARRRNSVDKLFFLYTVLCAFSLEQLAEQALNVPAGRRAAVWMLIGALVVTLVPFFHGALRHVHDTFEEEFPPPTRKGALLVAFVFLFLQALFFYALATSVQDPVRFATLFATLLAVDVLYGALAGTSALMPFLPGAKDALRGFFSFLRRPFGSAHPAELTWAYNNIAFLVPASGIVVAARSVHADEVVVAGAMLAVASLRTACDYVLSWTFYFPASAWQEEKVAAYTQTTYRADVDEEVINVRVGQPQPQLDCILERHKARSWAFVTACNPRSRLLTDSENDIRQARLAHELIHRRYPHYRGAGHADVPGWPPEDSYLVVGLSKEEALALGRAHEQYAIVYGEHGRPAELLFCTSAPASGPTVPDETGGVTLPQDLSEV